MIRDLVISLVYQAKKEADGGCLRAQEFIKSSTYKTLLNSITPKPIRNYKTQHTRNPFIQYDDEGMNIMKEYAKC